MAPRRRTRDYTRLQKGEIGELLLDSILEDLGFVVLHDWGKRVNEAGVDRVAYHPRTRHLYLIDNAAWGETIDKADGALSIERLGTENLDRVRATLDRHTGFSEAARDAWHDGRIKFVVANAHPDRLATRFSPKVFQRGWLAFDVVTGGMYSSWSDFNAARAQLGPQRGFASVGGMVFALVSIGGLAIALSEIDSGEELAEFAAESAVSGGIGYVAGRFAGSPAVGGLVSMLVTLKDDQGEPSEAERRDEVVASFLHHHFSDEQIAAGGDQLRAEARAFLFETEPRVLVDAPSDDGTVAGRLAMAAISALDSEHGPNRKLLLGVLMNAARNGHADAFYDALRAKVRPDRTDYFELLMAAVADGFGQEVAERLLARFMDALEDGDSEDEEEDADVEAEPHPPGWGVLADGGETESHEETPHEPGWGVLLDEVERDEPAETEESHEPGWGVRLDQEERDERDPEQEEEEEHEPGWGVRLDQAERDEGDPEEHEPGWGVRLPREEPPTTETETEVDQPVDEEEDVPMDYGGEDGG